MKSKKVLILLLLPILLTASCGSNSSANGEYDFTFKPNSGPYSLLFEYENDNFGFKIYRPDTFSKINYYADLFGSNNATNWYVDYEYESSYKFNVRPDDTLINYFSDIVEKLNKEYLEDIKQELNQTDLLFRKGGEIINLSELMVNNTNEVASVVLETQYLSFQVEYKNNDAYSIRRSVFVGIPVSFDLYLNINNSLYDANGNLTDINWQNN